MRVRKATKLFLRGLIVFILLFLLYVAVPSPPVPESAQTVALRKGRPVTRVYSPRYALKQNAIFEWKYDSSMQAIRINDVLVQLEPSELQWPDRRIRPYALIGDGEGVVFSWFTEADSSLIGHALLPRLERIDLRITRTISPKSEWDTSMPGIYFDFYAETGHSLLTIYFPTSPSSLKPLSLPSFTFPLPPTSSSPSLTFPLRLVLIRTIAPIALVFDMIGFSAAWVLIQLVVLLALLSFILGIIGGTLRKRFPRLFPSFLTPRSDANDIPMDTLVSVTQTTFSALEFFNTRDPTMLLDGPESAREAALAAERAYVEAHPDPLLSWSDDETWSWPNIKAYVASSFRESLTFGNGGKRTAAKRAWRRERDAARRRAEQVGQPESSAGGGNAFEVDGRLDGAPNDVKTTIKGPILPM